uniref:ATP synthase complex subunit 8 n=1 Tax=Glyptotermes sp. 8 AB-2022a TaxID=2942731 RepID=A0A8X8M1M6_9NEOP|nr:ATP synthase F0 subunit 8 [Glyptotermes sp. 8 AB-2022a]URX53010.1 ATP synthase F0 subunit 8 [Glyptotermes sp. 8 AB-2022a]
MPQMMPLSWITLFIMFSTALIIFSTMNYYSYIPKTKTTKMNKIITKKLNWKW